jgi:hypothetical protein
MMVQNSNSDTTAGFEAVVDVTFLEKGELVKETSY